MFKILFLIIFLALLTLIEGISYFEKIYLIIPTISTVLLVDLYILKKIEFYVVLTIGITLSFSLIIVYLISEIFFNTESFLLIDARWYQAIIAVIVSLCFYFSFQIGFSTEYFKKKKTNKYFEQKYLIDTCAIIDGRLLEIAKSGFIPKSLIIPNYVIQELQLISDSYNHEKRTKGRRGLDLLKHMKNSDHLSVQIINEDDAEVKTVDGKLLSTAKKNNYKIITTDFNLSKVAQLQGVQCLNINYLATLIKSNLNVGDRMRVSIAKKGNNKDQGIAFLPDDTMVVVENAEKFIGKQKQVVIMSYIQSESGKMAFANIV
jgi:uncharacterized protein YacL